MVTRRVADFLFARVLHTHVEYRRSYVNGRESLLLDNAEEDLGVEERSIRQDHCGALDEHRAEEVIVQPEEADAIAVVKRSTEIRHCIEERRLGTKADLGDGGRAGGEN